MTKRLIFPFSFFVITVSVPIPAVAREDMQ